jgi:bacterial/archaeal transporter family protein
MELFLIFLTVIFWGAAPIFDKAALKAGGDPLLGTIVRGFFLGFAMLFTALLAGKVKPLLNMPGRAVVFFVISALLAGALGVFTYFKALQSGATSKIVPLASTYPLITAALSALFLGESLTLARIAGIALIATGIFLVK